VCTVSTTNPTTNYATFFARDICRVRLFSSPSLQTSIRSTTHPLLPTQHLTLNTPPPHPLPARWGHTARCGGTGPGGANGGLNRMTLQKTIQQHTQPPTQIDMCDCGFANVKKNTHTQHEGNPATPHAGGWNPQLSWPPRKAPVGVLAVHRSPLLSGVRLWGPHPSPSFDPCPSHPSPSPAMYRGGGEFFAVTSLCGKSLYKDSYEIILIFERILTK